VHLEPGAGHFWQHTEPERIAAQFATAIDFARRVSG